jgi:cytoskeletal protein RodZ
MGSVAPEPGWYFDPDSGDVERFWDGSEWTEFRRARGEHSVEPSSTSQPIVVDPAPYSRKSEGQEIVSDLAQMTDRSHPATPHGTASAASKPTQKSKKPELKVGSAVRVASPGDDHDGVVGVVAEIVEDDKDGFDVSVRFADEEDLYGYSHNELHLSASEPKQTPVRRTSKRATSAKVKSAFGRRSASDASSRGSRWVVGTAALVLAVILALTAFASWANLRDDNFNPTVSAELSGVGTISVDVPGIADNDERQFVQKQLQAELSASNPSVPGWEVLVLAALMAAAAVVYRRSTGPSGNSAVGMTFLGALVLVNAIWRLFNVRGMFNAPARWSSADYTPGFGLVVAALASLALTALGITAFVIQRRSTNVTPE